MIEQQHVTDDQVMHRAVIDHTAQCETCRAERSCPYGTRLSQMARVARDIAREHREGGADHEISVRVGADSGTPTGPHCRAATLANRPAVHLACGRPGNCACYCHTGGVPAR